MSTFGMLFPMYYDTRHANSNLACNSGWIVCKLGRRHGVECNQRALVYPECNCDDTKMTKFVRGVKSVFSWDWGRAQCGNIRDFLRRCLFFFCLCVCARVESIVGRREMFSDSVWISSRSWQLLLMGFESHWVYSQRSLLAWTHKHSHTNINTRHI